MFKKRLDHVLKYMYIYTYINYSTLKQYIELGGSVYSFKQGINKHARKLKGESDSRSNSR